MQVVNILVYWVTILWPGVSGTLIDPWFRIVDMTTCWETRGHMQGRFAHVPLVYFAGKD
jgi:hypothetical protein